MVKLLELPVFEIEETEIEAFLRSCTRVHPEFSLSTFTNQEDHSSVYDDIFKQKFSQDVEIFTDIVKVSLFTNTNKWNLTTRQLLQYLVNHHELESGSYLVY